MAKRKFRAVYAHKQKPATRLKEYIAADSPDKALMVARLRMSGAPHFELIKLIEFVEVWSADSIPLPK